MVPTTGHSSSSPTMIRKLFLVSSNPTASSKMSDQWLDHNFEIIRRLFGLLGLDALDHVYRPNWRNVYPVSMNALAIVQILYLLWSTRSDMLEFLVILPNLLFATQGVQIFLQNTRRSGKILALRIKITEILRMLNESRSNGPIVCRVLQVSYLLQKVIYAFYLSSAVTVVVMPLVLWLVLGKKTLMFVFFIPGFDENTTEGFLLYVAMHAFMMPAAFCGYTAQECLFLAMFMPVGACVDALGNEVNELNSMLNLKERDDHAIRDLLKRIVTLHQLLNEYEAMLEELYSMMFLNKVGLIAFGIISAIVVILKSNDRMAYIFFALQFEQLTQNCLMGTIVSVKNEQLLDHLYEINWYQLSPEQAKAVGLMLHHAQNPTSVTIGKYAPLNLESYERIVKSIYTYVMILATLLE